jgi:hypothetical protein
VSRLIKKSWHEEKQSGGLNEMQYEKFVLSANICANRNCGDVLVHFYELNLFMNKSETNDKRLP